MTPNSEMKVASLAMEIRALLKTHRPEADFDVSHDYVGDGLLDSFDIVMLVNELEATFEINIPGECILPEHFTSALSLAALVHQLSAAQESP